MIMTKWIILKTLNSSELVDLLSWNIFLLLSEIWHAFLKWNTLACLTLLHESFDAVLKVGHVLSQYRIQKQLRPASRVNFG